MRRKTDRKSASSFCVGWHLIFKGVISVMNESFYCICASFVFHKMLIVIANLTWFVANFVPPMHSKMEENKCNFIKFSLHSWSQGTKKSRIHAHTNTNTIKKKYKLNDICLTPIWVDLHHK